MYISRLVKTRDPYPGLLQFAILFPSSFPVRLFPHCLLSLLLSLPSLFFHHRLSGGAATPFSLQGDLVLVSLVSERPSHVLQVTQSWTSWTNG
jgi:hypothetical protein